MAEQIYTNKNGLLNGAMINAIEEVGRNFVEVEDIIIRRIQLPTTIKQAIESSYAYEFVNLD